MLTSADEAQTSVNCLKNRIPRNSSALIGHYRLCDNFVTLVLKRQDTNKGNNNTSRRRRQRETIHDSGEQTFHVVSSFFLNLMLYVFWYWKLLNNEKK